MNNTFLIWLLGAVAVVGVLVGVTNIVTTNNLRSDVREIMMQQMSMSGNSEDSSLPMKNYPESATSTQNQEELPGQSHTNAQVISPTPMTQALAEQLVTQNWEIPLQVEEGPQPTVTYRRISGSEYAVTVIRPLLDDSTSHMKYEGNAEFINNTWLLLANTKTWKCHQGRGHQDYSQVPCV
jgi:hypothetical protein